MVIILLILVYYIRKNNISHVVNLNYGVFMIKYMACDVNK